MTSASTESVNLILRVHRIEWAAEGTVVVEFRDPCGQTLPPFTPGAHIELNLPNGIRCNYSLLNDSAEDHRYVVAVALDAASRGGSAYMHRDLRVGQSIHVSRPRNQFPLVEDAEHVVFIAGGIGITPICSMMRRLAALDRSFELHYATRTADRAAFLSDLRALGRPVHVHFDAEHGGAPLAIAPIIRAARPNAHFYCCGPTPMLDTFEMATRYLPEGRARVEYFKPKEQPPLAETGRFTVILAKSGRAFEIAADQTILGVLLETGISAEHSCMEGVCGTCETRIIEGTADHRNSVLSKSEREANRTMMICISRCLGDRLVLDL